MPLKKGNSLTLKPATLMQASRRGFLRGRIRSDCNDIRPPWAVEAGRFESLCTRCGDCVSACPTKVINPGDGAYPKVDFSAGECTFCGDCVVACEPAALTHELESAWSLRAVIGAACLALHGVECRVCGESCGEGAIRFRPRLGGIARPELEIERCTGCGACFAPCPVGAIAMERDQ